MEYQEFLEGTGIRRSDAAYTAFLQVESRYLDDPRMTKKQAYVSYLRQLPELTYKEFLLSTGYRDDDTVQRVYSAINLFYETYGLSKAQALAMPKRMRFETILEKAWAERQALDYVQYQDEWAKEFDVSMPDEYRRREHVLVRWFYETLSTIRGKRFSLGFSDEWGHYMNIDDFAGRADLNAKGYDIFALTEHTDYEGHEYTPGGSRRAFYSIPELIDNVCGFGGCVYISNERGTCRDITFEGPAQAIDDVQEPQITMC